MLRFKSKAGPKRSPKAVKILVLVLITLVLMFSPIFSVQADEGVNLTDLPQQLATALNIPLFASQILFSTLIISIFLFPTLILTKGRNLFATLIVGLSSMGFCIAMSWLPLLFLLLPCLLIAVMFAGKVKRWMS